MTREEKIKELQRQLDELKAEPKLEVGKWYYTKLKSLICITRIDGINVFAYGFTTIYNLNEWYDDGSFCSIHDIAREATPEEVESALIEEAKRRGFKEGVRFKCLKGGVVEFDNIHFGEHFDDGTYYLYTDCGVGYIFKNGKWAEIVTEPKVIVNGYEMEQEGDYVKFGCAKFKKEELIELMNALELYNASVLGVTTNRKIKSITLDSGVEITVEQLKEIVDNID